MAASRVLSLVPALFFAGIAAQLVACSSGTPEDPTNTGNARSGLKAGQCVDGSLGGPGSCEPADVWKKDAEVQCTQMGGVLQSVSVDGDCGNGDFVEAKFTCCGQQQPPPNTCTDSVVGAPGKGCIDDCQLKIEASDACKAAGLTLTSISFADDCNAPGQSSFAKYECCGQQPPPPPPPNACTDGVIGTPGQGCIDDKQLGDKAAATCQAAGQTLTTISFADDCNAPGVSSFAKYECCGQKVPPPNACTDGVIGGPGKVCTDDKQLDVMAAQSCQAQGLTLTTISFADDCAMQGQSSFAKYECCAQQPPPPPPNQCIDGVAGAPGQGCNDDGLLKSDASKLCATKGLTLTSISFADDCNVPGQSSFAKYECCAQQPPPPPPPNACTDGVAGSPNKGCVDDGVVKDIAAQACASNNQIVSSISFANDCQDPNQSSFAKYTCCK